MLSGASSHDSCVTLTAEGGDPMPPYTGRGRQTRGGRNQAEVPSLATDAVSHGDTGAQILLNVYT